MNRYIHLFLIFFCTSSFLASGQNILYVAPSGDNTSWQDADVYRDLQDALDDASAGDQVWVAKGTYLPTQSPDDISTNDRDRAFHFSTDLQLYGGFAGTETTLQQRDLQNNPTVLSGDFNGDDIISRSGSTLEITNNGENAYNVLITTVLTSAAIIDGFTLSGGNANVTGSISYEGKDFSRENGGGMYNNGSSITITNATFTNNYANSGGGMFNFNSSPIITNASFTNNYAHSSGLGGGMFNLNSSSPTITNATFVNNHANTYGGGMFNSSSSPTITNVTLTNNYAYSGGGMYNINSELTITNSILWANSASESGNNIFSTNSTPSISYSIIEGGGVDGEGNLDTEDPLFVDINDPDGPDNIHRTSDDGLTLRPCSPAIDAGTNSSGFITDILGKPSPYNSGTKDMGAYELQGEIIYVDIDATGANNGSSWGNAFNHLQEALDMNCSATEIWVAAGTYLPTQSPDGNTDDDRDKAFHFSTELQLYGGFEGTETTLDQRDPQSNVTILSGDFNQDDIISGSGSTLEIINNDENAYHVLITTGLTLNAIIDGFTISGGNADGTGSISYQGQSFSRENGGGMYDKKSSLTIKNAIFTNNYAHNDGGGIHNEDASPRINNSTFTNNYTHRNGGGIYNDYSSPTITNTTFISNYADSDGGGIHNDSGSPKIISSTFTNNHADEGGGIYNDSGSTKINNSTFTKNEARDGGGIYYSSTERNPSLTITNSILWSNSGGNIKNDFITSPEPNISYSIVGGSGGSDSWNDDFGSDRGNNLDTDPLFVDLDDPDGPDDVPRTSDDGLTLQPCSPAINAGTNSSGFSTDILGKPSPYNSGTKDMGAYELQGELGDIIYVNGNATGANNGTSWENAFKYLQDALDMDCSATEIWVAAGTYLPTESPDDISTDDRDWAFHFSTDLQLYGGFAGNEENLTDRDPQNNPTILSGDFNGDDEISGTGNDLSFSYNDENAYHVLITRELTSDAIIDGFIVSGGNATGEDEISYEGQSFDRNGGSGIFNISSSPVINRTTFINNHADLSGGALFNSSSSPTIANTVFTENSAQYGGGIFNLESRPSIMNTTVVGNLAEYGGGIYSNGIFISVNITNSVLWGNHATTENDNLGTYFTIHVISHSIIEGSGGSDSWNDDFGDDQGSNLDIDPLFVDLDDPDGDDDIPGTSDDGLALKPCSPAINMGTNDSGTDTDILGYPSPYDADTKDIGAYEFQGELADIIYVNVNATGANNGTSWENALTDLQRALDMNCSATEIWVAAGTYLPTQSPDGNTDDDRDKAFHFSTELQLYGGFEGTETTLDQRDPQNNPTILSGDFNQDDIISGSGGTLEITNNDENTYHVLITAGLTSNTNIDGFTISGGNADGTGNISYEGKEFSHRYGGGMSNSGSSPTITYTVFTNNYADDEGGGMLNDKSSSPDIMNATFTNNYSSDLGGGMTNISYSSPIITNTIFTNNYAVNWGGGICNGSFSSPNITNATFTNNYADEGGGIYNIFASITLTNSILWANTANSSGNNIFNHPHSSSSATISHSIIEGSGGSGDDWDTALGDDNGNNLDTDPLFVDLDDPDGPDDVPRTSDDGLALTACSPAINAGNNDAGIDTDILGYPSPYDADTKDIGAYEFQGELADIIYVNVNATGANNGTSWENALTDLQRALDMNCSTTEIWVAAGTYLPTESPDDSEEDIRDQAFHFSTDLQLYGGFAGTETTLDQRDPQNNPTILSGDFDANDVISGIGSDLSFTDNDENAYHVLITTALTSNAIIDGFTISGGNANGEDEITYEGQTFNREYGAGMYNNNFSSPVITNATFTNNHADQGGAMYNTYSSPDISNATFTNNHADRGGAMYNTSSSPNITNATFTNNHTDSSGGGMFNSNSSPNIANTTFTNNDANRGGAMYNINSSPNITNVTFTNNHTDSSGGVMYNSNSSPDITNVTFTNNHTDSSGGVMYNSNSSPDITNSILWANTANDSGEENIANYNASTPSISQSIIEGSGGSGDDWNTALGDDNGNNLDTDPLFVDLDNPNGQDDVLGTSDDGLALTACSPAIDAGTNDSGIDTDILGNPSPYGAGFRDTGAYEFQGSPISDVIYVDISASQGANDGTSWGNAYTELQPALDEACLHTEIWVAAGTYLPTESPDDSEEDTRDRAFHFSTDLQLYGGFADGEETLEERDPQNNPTILSGDFNGDDIISGTGSTLEISNNDENAYHVLITTALTSDAIIDGFTVSGGYANIHRSISYEGESFYHKVGAGMYNHNSSPTITNVTLTNNYANDYGGGMYNDKSSSPDIMNATFTNNYANGWGGGMFNDGSSPSISNVTFTNNYAINGGGMYNNGSSPTITNATFINNYADDSGGGMYNWICDPTIKNSILWANTAEGSGDNIANSHLTIRSPSISHSIIEGSGGSDSWDSSFGTDGGNNLDIDPLFLDISDPDGPDEVPRTSDDGLALKPCSPAIDAGTKESGIDTDILGYPSPYDAGTKDIGAYEFQGELGDIIYVNGNATGANNGSSWENALTDLQRALDMNCSATEIWVAAGTYLPTQSPDDSEEDTRDRAFHFSTDLQLYGGFAGGEETLDQRDPQNNPTVLSGDFDGDDLISGSGSTLEITNNGENYYHVMITHGLTDDTVIDGFTIRGGNANIYATIRYNESVYHSRLGGGIYHVDSSPTVHNVTIVQNCAISGGGMYSRSSSPNISNVTFANNHASDDAGGMFIESLSHDSSFPILQNVTFVGNHANDDSGALLNILTSPTLTNVSMTNNHANLGMGIFNIDGSPTISNTIIWGNTTDDSGGNIYNLEGSNPSISHSLIEGSGGSGTDSWNSRFGTDDGNNIDRNPFFINTYNPAGDDGIHRTSDDGLALISCSPAINMGNNEAIELGYDITGNVRLYAMGIIDMGAYELSSETSTIPTASIAGDDLLSIVQTSVSRTASGGIAYEWSDGLGSDEIVNIDAPGTYTVTVTDDVGCTATATTEVTTAPVIDSGLTFNRTYEDSPNNSNVGQALATDFDQSLILGDWQIVSGNTNETFAIESATGKIYISDNSALDIDGIDAVTTYELRLTVSNGNNRSDEGTVLILINDINDNMPVINDPKTDFTLAEDAVNGTSIATLAATDQDLTTTTFSEWEITSGNHDNIFQIDASSGEITIRDNVNLDRERTESYTLSITVSDGFNTSEEETITMNVSDVNDVLPLITENQSFTISENEENQYNLGTVTATDGDVTPTTFSDWTITAGNADGIFAINAETGEITVSDNTSLDYENTESYSLTITVSDGINTSSEETVTIHINDSNDNTPVITVAQSFNLNEDAANGTTVGTVIATDDDENTTFRHWTITAGNDHGIFTIHAETGEITVADNTSLNYETTESYPLSITVSDGLNTSSEETVTIHINDSNDNTPVITAAQSFNLNEDAANGTTVGTVIATDDDENTTFRHWTITAGNADGIFAINAETGEITVADNTSLDYESTESYSLTITVSDRINTSSEEIVTINIIDSNDNAPIITTSQNFNLNEDASNGTSLGTVEATDADESTTFRDWTITAGNAEEIFAINAETGEITVADNTNIDYETSDSYVLTITVSDGSQTSEAETVTIALNDSNDNAPVISVSQSFNLNEDGSNGTSLGTVIATDADESTSFSNWTITAGNADGIFAINAETGEITVADNTSLDYESTESYSLTITVSDRINTSSEEIVTINIIDSNDNTPVITAAQSFNLNEDAENGTSVGTVIATDDDENTTFRHWTITEGNADEIFAINTETGEITVADKTSLDYETTESYSLSITVSDGLNTSSEETVTIHINDSNDNAPIISASQNFNLNEDASNGTSLGTVIATDADDNTTFSDWTITEGNADEIFAINTETGEITVADNTSLDYETTESYPLSITVSDDLNTSSEETVTIHINDSNDNTPVITAAQSFNLNESANNGNSLGTVIATDADANAALSNWTITAGNNDGIFTINAETGEITVADKTSLDYETTESYSLSITVSDGLNTSSEETVTIHINDSNDNTPVITAAQSFNLNESAENGTIVGTVISTDDDENTTFRNWTITAGNDHGIFTIHTETGEITVSDNTSLDFETTESYALSLTVSDGVNTSAPETVTVHIIEASDSNQAPQISGLNDFSMNEDTEHTISFMVYDSDNTAGDLKVNLSLDTEEIFSPAMISISGLSENREITLTPKLNQFGETNMELTVSDGELSTTAQIIITVNPMNDLPSSLSLSNLIISKDAPVGFEVGTLSTEDVDLSDTHTYALVSGENDNNEFMISGETLLTHTNFEDLDPETKTVRIRSTDVAGTSIEETFVINLEAASPEKEIIITTSFTPNGDGINDTWVIDNIDQYPEARVTILNKQGQNIFESRGYNRPWDGTFNGQDLPVDTYYYIISLTGNRRKGFVMILK